MQTKFLVFIAFLAIAFVLLAVAASLPSTGLFIVLKFIVLILAIFSSILAFASRFYTYLIVPFIQQHSRHIVLSNENAYWLSTTNDAILSKDGQDFVASIIMNIPLYTSSTEMSPEEKNAFARQVGRLISTTGYPMRVTAQLYVMNKDLYIQQLREKISLMENQEATLTQSNAPSKEINKVHGALAMWKKMLDNISKETSFEMSTFAMISAKGSKEYEALNIAHQKAMEIMSGISSTLGVSPSIVMGNDILKFIEPEFLMPYSTVSEQITKNIQEEVI
ncbi:MAG: hypothetical protein ACP5SA_00490 [Candidatus Micrarchaeia archaeon]